MNPVTRPASRKRSSLLLANPYSAHGLIVQKALTDDLVALEFPWQLPMVQYHEL